MARSIASSQNSILETLLQMVMPGMIGCAIVGEDQHSDPLSFCAVLTDSPPHAVLRREIYIECILRVLLLNNQLAAVLQRYLRKSASKPYS